jgi:hypothetical protein
LASDSIPAANRIIHQALAAAREVIVILGSRAATAPVVGLGHVDRIE